MENEKLSKSDYQAAIYSQSAVNASGLIKSLAEITTRIWNTAREIGKGTAWVNQHPIIQLFTYQIVALSFKREFIDWDGYTKAYAFVQQVVNGNLAPDDDWANCNASIGAEESHELS